MMYEDTLEDIVVRNKKKESHNKDSHNYRGSPIQADYNLRRLFYLAILATES